MHEVDEAKAVHEVIWCVNSSVSWMIRKIDDVEEREHGRACDDAGFLFQ